MQDESPCTLGMWSHGVTHRCAFKREFLQERLPAGGLIPAAAFLRQHLLTRTRVLGDACQTRVQGVLYGS